MSESDPSREDSSSSNAGPTRGPVNASAAGGPPPPPPPGQPAYAYYPPPQQKSRFGGLKRIGLSILVSLLLLSVVANIYFGLILQATLGGQLREDVYQAGDTAHVITILPVEGMINDEQASFTRQAWLRLRENPPVAVVIRVNSGGGGISASDEMLRQLKEFKAEHPDVPVVASFGPVAASGGYYVVADADEILAERTTITGSIGVLGQVLTFEGTLAMLGVEPVVLTADGSPKKDIANNVFRDWNEQDRQALSNLLNNAYEVFVQVVHDGRTQALGQNALTMDEVREIANGETYTAEQAKNLKLIDDVGYLHDAIDAAARLANVPTGVEPHVTRIARPAPLKLINLLVQREQTPRAGLPDSPDELRRWVNELGQLQLQYRMAKP